MTHVLTMVMLVPLIIWLGLSSYLFYLDRRLRGLEQADRLEDRL